MDEHNRPIPGTEERYTCDTLLLSTGLIPENELSRACGVEINRVTNGPVVNELLETSIPGIFACGNVLHVHDLVDYVSQEAALAGVHAAKYVAEGCGEAAAEMPVTLTAKGGVRYTVPSSIHLSRMDDLLTVRFRVGAVYQNAYINVWLDDERILHQKKRIMAPGEMEQVILQKKVLAGKAGLQEIVISVDSKE